MSVNEAGHDSVEKSIGKVLRQIDECLSKLSDGDQVDFLASQSAFKRTSERRRNGRSQPPSSPGE